MNTEFQDFQDQRNPRSGATLSDRSDTLDLLAELRNRQPPLMCQFAGDHGFSLIVGVDRDFGCIQHSANDGSPPYLMATLATTSTTDQSDMEFLCGGTPTPIDGRYRVPFDLLTEVVAHFVTTGERSSTVRWEEFA